MNLKKDIGGFNGKLCQYYYDLVRTDIQQYNAFYISGYDRLPSEIEQVMNKVVDVSNE